MRIYLKRMKIQKLHYHLTRLHREMSSNLTFSGSTTYSSFAARAARGDRSLLVKVI